MLKIIKLERGDMERRGSRICELIERDETDDVNIKVVHLFTLSRKNGRHKDVMG